MSNELVPYSDIEKMGKAIASSGLFGVKTEAQAVALMLIAQAYGQHPAIAAMEYHIIEGRPSKKAEAMLASFIQAGGRVKWITLTDEKAEASFSHPYGGDITIEWTIDRAKKAGLVDKLYSNYKKYPRAMLRSRVIAEGVRTIYPAATGGMLAKEEIEDIDFIDVKQDSTKSRLENIIDTQVEEVKQEVKESPPHIPESSKETKKVKKESSKTVSPTGPRLAKTQWEIEDEQKQLEVPLRLIVQGFITEIPISRPVDKDGKTITKYSFKIEDKYYGTFDESLFKSITDSMDRKIKIEFTYTTRTNEKGTIFQDIIGFKEIHTGESPI